MAKAETIVTIGMSLTLQKWDTQTNNWSTDKVSLCGVSEISPSAEEPETVDVTDFCSAAETGMKKELAGLKKPGKITLTVAAFDPLQDGQKLLDEAAKNDRFLLEVKGGWRDGKTITFSTEIQKTQNRTPKLSVGGKVEANFEMQMNRDFTFAVA